MSKMARQMVRNLIRDLIPYGVAVRYASKRERRRRVVLAARASEMRRAIAPEAAIDRIPRINVGCGAHIQPRWWNIDASPNADLCHRVEVGAILPFESASLDVVFSEHFLEHLSFDAALWFMQEAARVLRPGGTWRCSTPDLDWIARCIDGNWRNLASVYENIGDCLPGTLRGPCQVLNWAFRGHGHQYLWNFDELRGHLLAAGFANVRQVRFGESAVPGAAIEIRKAEAFYSLIVEATRL